MAGFQVRACPVPSRLRGAGLERRRAALVARVVDQSLADQLLDGGGAAAAPALPPPGAEQLADHELGVERAAYGQQLTRRAQQLGEERVRRRRAAPPLAAP